MGTGGKCGTSLTGSVKVGVENTLVAFKGAGGRVYGLEKKRIKWSFTIAGGRANEMWDLRTSQPYFNSFSTIVCQREVRELYRH